MAEGRVPSSSPTLCTPPHHGVWARAARKPRVCSIHKKSERVAGPRPLDRIRGGALDRPLTSRRGPSQIRRRPRRGKSRRAGLICQADMLMDQVILQVRENFYVNCVPVLPASQAPSVHHEGVQYDAAAGAARAAGGELGVPHHQLPARRQAVRDGPGGARLHET